MINVDEIDKTILELEQHDTTFATVEKLAWLYTVKDHLVSAQKAPKTAEYNGSTFMCACSQIPVDLLLSVLDEHFEAVRVLYPKEYDAVIRKLNDMK